MSEKGLTIRLSKRDREEVRKLLANRVTNRDIKEELRAVLRDMLTSELIEKVIEDAAAKAIKDAARWKLLRDANEVETAVLETIRRNRAKLSWL